MAIVGTQMQVNIKQADGTFQIQLRDYKQVTVQGVQRNMPTMSAKEAVIFGATDEDIPEVVTILS